MDPRRPSSRGIGAQQNYSQLPQRGGSLRGDRDSTRRGQASPAPAQAPEPQYVVYLRLPFNRNGFVDPPQVEWDAAKERYLWKVLSRGNRNAETDWDELAGQLQVPRAFLLQQAAWLYKRELDQIQAQIRRVSGISPGTLGTSSSPINPTPNAFPSRPGTASGEGRPLSSFANRPGTGFIDTHPPSAVATPRPHAVLPGSPARAVSQLMSRGPSSQSHTSHPLSRFTPSQNPTPSPRPPSPSSPTDSTISSSSSNDEQTISTHGGVRKLPGFFTKKRHHSISSNHYHHSINSNLYDHDSSSSDNDDGVPAFLPFSATTETGSDLTGTITLQRRSGERQRDRERGKEREPMSAITSATASVVSESAAGSSGGEAGSGRGAGGTMRQHHHHRNRRSVLGGVDSPNRSSAGPSSPSMGSSFSDLSDTSVTQSAMEEAYLSTLQAGGMASRMSSLGQAVRSRYFTPQGGRDGGGQQ